jgi:hypothetical protein
MIKYGYSIPELKVIAVCCDIAQLKANIESKDYILGLTDYNIAVQLYHKQEELMPYLQNESIKKVCDFDLCRKFLSEFIFKYRKKHDINDRWHL